MSAVLGVAGGVGAALVTDDGEKGSDPLSLGVALADQPCTGQYLLVTAVGETNSALGPSFSENPETAHYLAIDGSCPTAWKPRGTLSDGYAAYLGPYGNAGEACAERVLHRGAFVTELRRGNATSTPCLCFLDPDSLPELTPGQAVATEDGVYVRMLEDLLTSMHLLRLDHHFNGRYDPLLATAVKQVQKEAVLPQNGVTDHFTWHSLRKQGCQEIGD